MKNNYFFLFSNCIPVAGKKGAIICDIQRGIYLTIPLELFELLTTNKQLKCSVEELKQKYNHEVDAGIDTCFDYLIQKGVGMLIDDISCFPELKETWSHPGEISNAIIEVGENITIHRFASIIKELTDLGCYAVEIRISKIIARKDLFNLLRFMNNSSIRYAILFLPYDDNWDFDYLSELMKNYPMCGNIVVHSAHNSSVNGRIVYTTNKLTEKSCGNINKFSFTLNVKSYSEAISHNSCLNRKMSIDKEGYIKNCPSMKEHYGNIRDTTLQQALEHPDFKKYWNVNKDQIKVCQDCEFRYICTDCRAYVEDPQDRYSKPLKCGYNPYTCEWEEWSTNPLKQKAIDHYNLRPIL